MITFLTWAITLLAMVTLMTSMLMNLFPHTDPEVGCSHHRTEDVTLYTGETVARICLDCDSRLRPDSKEIYA